MNNIAQRIKELRVEKGLTQAELAEGIITRSYLSQIERGAFEPSYDVLEKISKKLGCDIEELLNQQPKNKNLIAVQVQRDIKLAEKNIQESNIDKAKKIIESATFNLLEEDIKGEEKGVLYWINGKVHEKNKEYSKAIELFQKSIDLLEGINHEKVIRSLTDLGYVYSLINKNKDALRVLNKANRLAIYEHVGGHIRVSLLLNLGIVHGKLDELYSAINFLEEAIELNRSLEIFYKSGEINMALGICYMQLGEIELAQQSYVKAVEFFTLGNDSEKIAGTLNNLGILYRKIGNLDKSIEKLEESVKIFKTLNDLKKRFNVELELAATYLELNEYDKVNKICNNVINLDLDKVYISKSFELLGDMEERRNNYSLAMNYYNSSMDYLEDYNDIAKRVKNKIATVFHVLGEYEKSSSLLLNN